jgi:hypothetical protein
MKTSILICFILSTSGVLYAQHPAEHIDSRPKNSIHLNLLGDASIISANYERLFVVRPKFIISSKLGLGYNEEFRICFGPCVYPPEKYTTIPHHITGNVGKRQHFFEFGIGGTKIIGNTSQPYLLYSIVGYRILPLSSKRLNFSGFILVPYSGLENGEFYLELDYIFFIPFGFSLGVSF